MFTGVVCVCDVLGCPEIFCRLEVLVDLVHLELLSALEFLTTDVTVVDFEVNLAVVVVEQVSAWEGHVASLALLLGVVIVDVILEFTIAAKDFTARLAKFAVDRLGVDAGNVTVALRFLGERSTE